jgi:hypothetical protein
MQKPVGSWHQKLIGKVGLWTGELKLVEAAAQLFPYDPQHLLKIHLRQGSGPAPGPPEGQARQQV